MAQNLKLISKVLGNQSIGLDSKSWQFVLFTQLHVNMISEMIVSRCLFAPLAIIHLVDRILVSIIMTLQSSACMKTIIQK